MRGFEQKFVWPLLCAAARGHERSGFRLFYIKMNLLQVDYNTKKFSYEILQSGVPLKTSWIATVLYWIVHNIQYQTKKSAIADIEFDILPIFWFKTYFICFSSWVPDKKLSNFIQITNTLAALLIKGIVSRDFEVCFLVPLDSSDIATPDGTGSFFKIKSILCWIFDYLGLGASSFHYERISAQRATAAHSTPLPELIFVIVFITHSWNTIKLSKVSQGVIAQSAPLLGLIWTPVAPCQSYIWSPICTLFLWRSLTGATKWAAVTLWAEIRSHQKLLAPRPE
jgi:hypothetical protein